MEDSLVFTLWGSTCLLSQEGQHFTRWGTNVTRCLCRVTRPNIRTSKGKCYYCNIIYC